MLIKRCEFGKGSGRIMAAFTTLKMAVFAPMPRARVRMATRENAGALRIIRRANRKSCIIGVSWFFSVSIGVSERVGVHCKGQSEEAKVLKRVGSQVGL